MTAGGDERSVPNGDSVKSAFQSNKKLDTLNSRLAAFSESSQVVINAVDEIAGLVSDPSEADKVTKALQKLSIEINSKH